MKTIPFTAAHTYIAHIWQYPPPGCVTNTDCTLADWQVNEVNIVVKCLNRFPIPKL